MKRFECTRLGLYASLTIKNPEALYNFATYLSDAVFITLGGTTSTILK